MTLKITFYILSFLWVILFYIFTLNCRIYIIKGIWVVVNCFIHLVAQLGTCRHVELALEGKTA